MSFRSLANAVWGNGGNEVLDMTSRALRVSLAYWVDRIISLSRSYKALDFDFEVVRDSREPTGSMNRA